MKKTFLNGTKLLSAAAILFCTTVSKAQFSPIQYLRPNDKTGLNTFETTKKDTLPFDGLKLRIGGNFTQDFQGLRNSNTAQAVTVDGVNQNQLNHLTSAFNLAMANLNIDVQLADGVRMNLTTYLSTRHHQDTWVKGGYIQFDKLPFLKSDLIDDIMKKVTVKIGDFEVDYGDAHFRRTDGGNSIYNPFVENYILDAFATEIGGEVYYHADNGLFLMGGITNGQLDPAITKSTTIDASTGYPNHASAAFHGKLGYDKQINSDFRFRLTGSFYTVASSPSNTLYWGDRAGSHYFLVMENSSADAADNAWSGRLNPEFSEEVHSYMINPFIKYKGLEIFGTGEFISGRTITETDTRNATQFAGDIVYRFPANKENFWIGARYNTVRAELPGFTDKVTVNRAVGSIGWFFTKNIMMKAEYVNQKYNHFPTTDIRNGGKFNGFMIEASVGF